MQGPSWAGADASLLGHSLHGLHGDRAREYDGERLPGEGGRTPCLQAGTLANRHDSCQRALDYFSILPREYVQRIEDAFHLRKLRKDNLYAAYCILHTVC